MAIALLGSGGGQNNSTGVTYSYTCHTGTDRALVVFCTTRNTAATPTVTYGGVTMTQIGSQTVIANRLVWAFFLPDASFPSVGAQNVVVSFGAGDRCYSAVFELSGASQTTPTNFTGVGAASGDTTSVNITAVANDWLLSMAHMHVTTTTTDYWAPNSGQTETYDSGAYTVLTACAGYEGPVSSGTQSSSWVADAASSTAIGQLVVAISEAAGGATVDATGDDAAIAVAAGQVVPSLTIQATGSGIGIAAAAGQVTTAGDVTGAGSGASVATAAGQAVSSGTVAATGSDAALAVADGTVTPVTGIEVQATGSGIGIATAAGQVTLASTVLADGSGVTILAVAGQAFVPGIHTLAPADRTFYDEVFDSTFRDESASLTFAD